MEKYQGYLQELGQAEKHPAASAMEYTYIEIGDQMLKKVTVFTGLDGKLNNELGKNVTLHVSNGYVLGLTTQEGKSYRTEKSSGSVGAWILIIMGILLSLTLIGAILGLPMFVAGFKMLSLVKKINVDLDLPNAIEIPI